MKHKSIQDKIKYKDTIISLTGTSKLYNVLVDNNTTNNNHYDRSTQRKGKNQ